MKHTYKVCFIHQRIWHPGFLGWEKMVHTFQELTRENSEVHLTAIPCDKCEDSYGKTKKNVVSKYADKHATQTNGS